MSERNNRRPRTKKLGTLLNETDQFIPADAGEHTDPRQADIVQEGRGPAGADRDAPAPHTDPQRADVVQEGRGPAGEEPDRVQELFRLLKRALEEQTDPAAVARTFRARQDAQLMEVACEIEQLERSSATTVRELREALAAVQNSINRAIEDTQGENNLREALIAYKRIKARFWERLVKGISADLEEVQAQLRAELRAVEADFRAQVAALRSGTGARVPFRRRIERDMWLLAGTLVVGMALGGALRFDQVTPDRIPDSPVFSGSVIDAVTIDGLRAAQPLGYILGENLYRAAFRRQRRQVCV